MHNGQRLDELLNQIDISDGDRCAGELSTTEANQTAQ
jgi:hypothetical protein